jgi:hypothetical protein
MDTTKLTGAFRDYVIAAKSDYFITPFHPPTNNRAQTKGSVWVKFSRVNLQANFAQHSSPVLLSKK